LNISEIVSNAFKP